MIVDVFSYLQKGLQYTEIAHNTSVSYVELLSMLEVQLCINMCWIWVQGYLFVFTCRCLRGWLASWPPVGQQGSFWRWSKTAILLAELYWSRANLAQERLPSLWVRATLEAFQNTLSFHQSPLEVILLPCSDVIGKSYIFIITRDPAPIFTKRIKVQLRLCFSCRYRPVSWPWHTLHSAGR